MRTREENMKMHKKAKKIKASTTVYENVDHKDIPDMDIKYYGDESGFYTKVVGVANGDSQYVDSVKGKPRVTIEDWDMDMKVTIHGYDGEPDKSIDLSLGDLAEVVEVMLAYNHIHKKKSRLGLLSERKIKKVKMYKEV